MILGLTGGMGSGKSTAAGYFVRAGFRRIDSDQLVRDEILPDSSVIEQAVSYFGQEVGAAGGGLDRAAVADRIFSDDKAREWWEQLVHPRVFASWRARFAADPAGPWIVEVPLLFEKGLENWFDFTICVATSSAQQLARLEARGVPGVLAAQRISKQLPLAPKLEQADYVLLNDGSVDFLSKQVERLLASLPFTTAL